MQSHTWGSNHRGQQWRLLGTPIPAWQAMAEPPRPGPWQPPPCTDVCPIHPSHPSTCPPPLSISAHTHTHRHLIALMSSVPYEVRRERGTCLDERDEWDGCRCIVEIATTPSHAPTQQ
eukprot:364794-Chlamydomonas_euryale.AAC.19